MATIKDAKKAGAVQLFKSWSASRLDDYDQCPFKAKLKHLDKLCPICFKGKLKGGFDTPAVCSACGKTPEKVDALVRGGVIGDTLDKYLLGKATTPGPTIKHPQVKEIVKAAKAAIKKGLGAVQVSLRFTSEWKLIPGDGFDPRAWLYTKLDYQRISKSLGTAHVTDWKTGGVERRGPETGKVKVADKYDDQLLTYQVATLLTQPDVQECSADLVFLDCGDAFDPVLDGEPLTRKQLPEAIKQLTKKAAPLLSDTVFAPKASFACSWCDYAKKRGGPCKFGT